MDTRRRAKFELDSSDSFREEEEDEDDIPKINIDHGSGSYGSTTTNPDEIGVDPVGGGGRSPYRRKPPKLKSKRFTHTKSTVEAGGSRSSPDDFSQTEFYKRRRALRLGGFLKPTTFSGLEQNQPLQTIPSASGLEKDERGERERSTSPFGKRSHHHHNHHKHHKHHSGKHKSGRSHSITTQPLDFMVGDANKKRPSISSKGGDSSLEEAGSEKAVASVTSNFLDPASAAPKADGSGEMKATPTATKRPAQGSGALPRTLSTSVLRIKHRRTFWERVTR